MNFSKTLSFLKKNIGRIDVAILTGSGLSDIHNLVENKKSFSYSKIFKSISSKVPGHENILYYGTIFKHRVVIFSGRFHIYEGFSTEEVVLPVRVAAALDCKTFIVTNAAGGIRKDLKSGDLMLIKDHINLSGVNPLIGYKGKKEIFINMNDLYSKRLLDLFYKASKITKVDISEGVYAYVKGPSYETLSEIKMLKILGADAVGMSTVPEVIVARQENMEIAGLSIISNRAGLSVSHQEVLNVTKKAVENMKRLLKSFFEIL